MPSLNFTADFTTVTDGLEAVTYRCRGDAPGSAGRAIQSALRRAVTTHEAAASDGRYTTSDVVWHLAAAELPFAPRLGDMICDISGQRWTILSATRTMLGVRWMCTTRSLAIVFGLDDAIGVLKAVGGTSGGSVPTWRTWKTGIRARIQPKSMQVTVVNAVPQTVRSFQIFIAEPLGLDASHRILAADGSVYRILAETAAERIGELSVIDVEKLSP